MLQDKKIHSLLFYVKKEFRFVIFFTLFFSLLAITFTFLVNPVFNATSRVYVSGQSSMLANLSSKIPFNIGSGGGNIDDELEMLSSVDLKKVVFEQSDAKIKWDKVDPKIRHFIVFDSIPLTEEPKKIKIKIVRPNHFEVFISKKYNGVGKLRKKLPFTVYNQYCEANSGEVVNVNHSFNFMITNNNLEVGDEYIFEIGYKFPKNVSAILLNKINVSSEDMSNIFNITTTSGDAIKVVDLNLSFFEHYIKLRYKDVQNNQGKIAKIINKKIARSKRKIDSLSREQKRLSKKYKIIAPEEEATEIYKNYANYHQLKSTLVFNKNLTQILSPYDSVKIIKNKIQLSEVNSEIRKLKRTLYKTYPAAIVDFFTVKYQLQEETSTLSELVVKKEMASISEIMEIGNRKLFEKPQYPFSRAKPQRLKTLIIYFVFGIFVGFLYIFFLRYSNRKLALTFDFNIGVLFTIASFADKRKVKSYLKEKIKPLIDDDILVGYYGISDLKTDNYLKEEDINCKITNHIIDQAKFTTKNKIAIICKYNEVKKSDLIKLEEKFHDQIIWIVYDVEYSQNEYFYDKFVDDYFNLLKE